MAAMSTTHLSILLASKKMCLNPSDLARTVRYTFLFLHSLTRMDRRCKKASTIKVPLKCYQPPRTNKIGSADDVLTAHCGAQFQEQDPMTPSGHPYMNCSARESLEDKAFKQHPHQDEAAWFETTSESGGNVLNDTNIQLHDEASELECSLTSHDMDIDTCSESPKMQDWLADNDDDLSCLISYGGLEVSAQVLEDGQGEQSHSYDFSGFTLYEIMRPMDWDQ